MGKNKKDRVYGDCMEIVEEAMEWIAKRWTFSMMKRELREYFPGLSASSCRWILTQAKREIVKRYNIDPKEYKGKQIAFYESVIRGGSKTHDKLTAAERLDKLFGLEHISMEDPEQMAEKIITFKKQAEATVGGQGDGGSENVRARENEVGDTEVSSGNRSSETSSQEKKEEKLADGVDIEITPADPEIKTNIDDVLKKQLGHE